MTAKYKTICQWLDPNNLPSRDLSKHSIVALNSALEKLIEQSLWKQGTFTAGQAAGVWLLVTELLNRGMAPHWISKHLRELLKCDLELFDLYWLMLHCPRHQTTTERWDKCFNPDLDEITRLKEIHRIAGLLSYSTRKKRHKLSLSNRQKICCLRFSDYTTRELRDRINRTRGRAAKRIRAKSTTTKAEQNIGTKLRWWECARLVGKNNPTDMAWVYKAMTGKAVTRQAARKAVLSLQRSGLLTR